MRLRRMFAGSLASGALIVGSLALPSVTTHSMAATPVPLRQALADMAPDCVSNAKLVDVTTILGGAQAYHMQLGGNEFVQVVPAPGWSPVLASDEELEAYGFPPRPPDPDALAQWTADYSHWKAAAQPGMCELPESAAASGPHFSSNWAGGMNNGAGFTGSSLTWTQPGFTYTCGTAAKLAWWSGLGGWNYPGGQERLIQGGTDTATDLTGSHPNIIFPWWEMLTTNTDNPMVKMGGPTPAIAPGHQIRSTVTYNSAGGFAVMAVYDITTGITYSSGAISSYQGHPTSYYYDGSTSDFISEAPTNSAGNVEPLRRPTSPVHFSAAYTNGNSIGTYGSWNIVQGTASHHIDDSSFDGSHAWNTTWRACY